MTRNNIKPLLIRAGALYGNSSVGRASVSKTEGRGFESSFPCTTKKAMIKKFIKYCQTCYDELAHKVTWPTYKELTGSAMLVLTASVIIALVVFAMDKIFETLMRFVYPS